MQVAIWLIPGKRRRTFGASLEKPSHDFRRLRPRLFVNDLARSQNQSGSANQEFRDPRGWHDFECSSTNRVMAMLCNPRTVHEVTFIRSGVG